jgi:hypothetical protein
MKTILFILITIPLFSQVHLNNANINIKGNLRVFGDVEGKGSITVGKYNKFRAVNVSCNIDMIHYNTSSISYHQDTKCRELKYKAYNLIGQYLFSGISIKGKLNIKRYKHQYLFLVFENGTKRKIFIN